MEGNTLMRNTWQSVVVIAGALLFGAIQSSAQSLGEVARQEAARRQQVRDGAKVYTNETLTPDFTASVDPASPPAEAPGTGASSAESAAAGTSDKAGAGAGTGPDAFGVTPLDQQEPQPQHDKGEDYWRERANRIRSRLTAQNAEIEALRQRVASFPPGSALPERELANAALTRAVADLKAFNDEWARFERQARDRGVPDIWIR